jgi:iron complex outermembrane receptor protein
MKKFQQNTLKGLACSVSAMALVLSASAAAQDPVAEEETAEAPADITEDEADAQPESGSIVVTGSRIKRDTYSSISPLQVLTTEASQEAGLFDPSQILQRSESASGQQVDATFQGFVLDNGPGSVTLNLRGLGPDRTLLLVNGRRLAPAGVEGAPSAPSINLLPGSLIERYELLLDGASSVYGSDAVAGVGNVILRKDFDGPELFARGEINPQGSGEDYTISGAWGFNTDRGFIGIGAEYDYRDAIRLRDRDFFQGCDTHYEVDQAGNIRTIDLRSNADVMQRTPGVSVSEQACKVRASSGRFNINNTFLNDVYYEPNGAPGNLAAFGIPGFSTPTNAFGTNLDLNNDGVRDVDLQDFNSNGTNLDQVFLSEQKLINVMAYGEYTFPGAANITPYFEANYSRAEIKADNTGSAFIQADVPAENQFSPCNIQAGGADCRQVDNDLANFPIWGGFRGPTGINVSVYPTVVVRGDRNNTEVTQEQYRGVFGVKGDLPFIGSNWTFDVSGVYSRSEGNSIRRGIREDKLAFAIGIDPTADFSGDGVFDNDGDGIADDYSDLNQFGIIYGDPGITPCDASGLSNPSAAMADLTQGCVPVNLFAPSLLGAPIGDFATQAERDYVFGTREFDTTYEQLTLSGFVTGDLFELPAGSVATVLGVEYRKDRIDSNPNLVASNGLLYNFFSDGGASGSKRLLEAFGEIDIPLQAGKPWVEELNLNLSGRVTDEEFYGTNYTYAIKGGWRPIEQLLLKMSYGTSFRAPNLRENFLRGQTGFATLFDPCAVPSIAFDAVNGVYLPDLETRDGTTLQNCVREGRDPLQVGLAPNTAAVQRSSVEIESGGSFDINPETSRSITAGFAFEETVGDGFDISLGFNYFDIKLKDSIIEPSSQFIINDCFLRTDGTRSPFCDRLDYDPLNADGTIFDRGLVANLDSGFLNLNQESVRGLDINATFGKEVALFGKLVDFGLDVRANHLMERSTTFINDVGDEDFDDRVGEFSLPKWTGRTVVTADIDDLRLTWQVRYTGPVAQDFGDQNPFSDAFGFGPDGSSTGVDSDTCTGGGNTRVVGDGIFCRDVDFAKEQFLHTASIRYRFSGFTLIAGVDNIFNTAPPQVDGRVVQSIANTAIGNGYDYDGREFFFSVQKEF